MYCHLENSSIIFICITYVICTLISVNGMKWPTKEEELLDEIRDDELLKTVQKSMQEWEKLHNRKHRKKRADNVVCYGELGCFEESGPFGYFDMLPASPEEINTKFYFYSTKNRSDRPLVELPYLNMSDVWDEFKKDNDQIKNRTTKNSKILSKIWQSFKSLDGLDKLSIRVIVHGFGSSCPHVWIYEMRAALMAVEDCIVICVDWENGANLPNYVKAAANTRIIGKQLALLLRGLEKYKGLELSRVHVIGFSLGAHASGFAGAELPGLHRITGLDPAGPLFEAQHPKARLDSSDAKFVDVIHSNGENLILGGLGSWQPMGHVDFYPNGGRVQNGCSNLFVGAVTDFIWSPAATVEGRSLCNHRRAYKFFIDSVASRCLFPAFPCDSYDEFLKGECFPCKETSTAKCGNMGYYADRSTGRGQLYLITREEEPFCAHQFHIEIHSSENDLPLRTLGKLEVILEGDGYLNETFSITEKDDTEFFAGDIISRIIVPHPALGFPHSVTLTYKSYSGWLSKGLPHWTIHKVVLTDSFGKSLSLCKRHIFLETGKPVYIKLKSGNCHIPDENDINFALKMYEEKMGIHVTESINLSDNDKNDYINGTENNDNNNNNNNNIEKLRNKKDIINMGTSFKMTHNNTYSLVENESNSNTNLPWQPLLDGGNLLEQEANESSRNANNGNNKHNEIIAPTVINSHHKERKMHNFSDEEIVEPILKNRKSKINNNGKFTEYKEAKTNNENSFFTVQLLPFRLGELFERAERYARETLLPLISEQAPKFFSFINPAVTDEKIDRTPKYIPYLNELAEQYDTTELSKRKVIVLPSKHLRTRDEIFPDYSDNLTEDAHINNNNNNNNDINNTDNNNNNINNINDTTEISLVDKNNDQIPAESQTNFQIRSIKDLLSILRTKEMNVQQNERSISSDNINNNNNNNNNINTYYTNLDLNSTTTIKSEDDLRIKIDLPTYKPPTTVFPYTFELPNYKLDDNKTNNLPLIRPIPFN